MQLALNHPAQPAGQRRLPFLLFIADEPGGGEAAGHEPAACADSGRDDQAEILPPQRLPAVEALPMAPDYRLLYAEECARNSHLEQQLAGAMMLLNETAAERDRWYGQAHDALALSDRLRRQLDLLRRPLRIIAPRLKRRRFFGLF
jgi:hypothetical protein